MLTKWLCKRADQKQQQRTYPKNRPEYFTQLPNVGGKWAIWAFQQHIWCYIPSVLTGPHPSGWESHYNPGRWVRIRIEGNSKSLIKYRIGKRLRNGAQSCVDQFVSSGWHIPPAKLTRMLSLSMSYSKITFGSQIK
jgi:hypothetical protein